MVTWLLKNNMIVVKMLKLRHQNQPDSGSLFIYHLICFYYEILSRLSAVYLMRKDLQDWGTVSQFLALMFFQPVCVCVCLGGKQCRASCGIWPGCFSPVWPRSILQTFCLSVFLCGISTSSHLSLHPPPVRPNQRSRAPSAPAHLRLLARLPPL